MMVSGVFLIVDRHGYIYVKVVIDDELMEIKQEEYLYPMGGLTHIYVFFFPGHLSRDLSTCSGSTTSSLRMYQLNGVKEKEIKL